MKAVRMMAIDAALALPVVAAAQQFDSSTRVPYRRWDGGGAGLCFCEKIDTVQTDSTRPPYSTLSIANSPSRLEARPVLGGGFKSYFR